jgi:hypothetical protein
MTNRDKHRDGDDVRAPLAGDDRSGTKPDTRNEARGDARDTVGNNARGTDANPTGPEGNDRTRNRPQRDQHDVDLEQYDRERLD